MSWPAKGLVRVRFGLHSGEAHERDADYFGPAVNVAARVMSVARGGQVLVSDTTRQLVPDVSLVDLGQHRLRGFVRSGPDLASGRRYFGPLRIGGEQGNQPPRTPGRFSVARVGPPNEHIPTGGGL